MRTIYSILFSVTFLSINLNAQLPELVVDFNVGSDDSFRGKFEGAYIGSDIILPIFSSTQGEELAIISNGQLSILKDIYPGIESSDPTGFTTYNGEIYFSAKESENNTTLWKTDGTTAGTQMVFDPGTSDFFGPQAFIVAQNGWMYFGYEDKIFRTDGTNHEEIYEGVSLGFDFANASNNYCTYNNGIAFIKKNGDHTFSIHAIDDDQEVELARTAETDFFADGIGIAPVTDGLMFSIHGSDIDGIDGIYVYNENDQSLNTLPIDNELIPSRRTINFNDDLNISWIASKGYYLVNGEQNEEELIFATDNVVGTQGESFLHSKYNDKTLFVVTEGFWGDEYLMISDGTATGTENLTVLQPFQSNIASYDKYAYIAAGTSNGFIPDLYQVDMETGELILVYAFPEGSFSLNSIQPIGVQNNKLYFLSDLDPAVGRELYSIELDIETNITEFYPDLDFKLIQTGNNLEIEMEETVNLQIAIYNLSGIKLFNRSLQSNQSFDIDVPSGMYFMHIEQNNKHASVPFHVVRN